MISLDFDLIPSLNQLKSFINSVERDVVGNLRDFWDSTARKLVAEEIARIFATQGYGGWAPLSPRYALRKSKIYPLRTILRAKDVYFWASTRKGESGNIFESTPSQMTWGADEAYFEGLAGFPYPVVLEKGNRSGTIHARPVYETANASRNLQELLINGLEIYIQKRINDEARKVFG